MPETREIPRAGWNDFFSDFSRAHETQLVAVEVMGSDIGAQIEGQSLLFDGISEADDKHDSIALTFDSVNGEHLTHLVNHPKHVWLQRGADQSDQALEIEAADGTTTLVRFPSVDIDIDTERQDDNLIGRERFPRKGDEPF